MVLQAVLPCLRIQAALHLENLPAETLQKHLAAPARPRQQPVHSILLVSLFPQVCLYLVQQLVLQAPSLVLLVHLYLIAQMDRLEVDPRQSRR